MHPRLLRFLSLQRFDYVYVSFNILKRIARGFIPQKIREFQLDIAADPVSKVGSAVNLVKYEAQVVLRARCLLIHMPGAQIYRYITQKV